MLAGIDYFVVVAYLVVILLLGYYFRKFVSSSDDYFLGGRTLPFGAIGILLETLMGWSIWFSIIFTAGVTGLYTYFGGIVAVVMTDVVQMIIMFVGGFTLVFLSFYYVREWEGLVTKVYLMEHEYQNILS